MLALALGAFGASYLGYSNRKAMQIGLLTALFALLPDIDLLFATDATLQIILAQATVDAAGIGVFDGTVHRGLTHSLPITIPVAVLAYLTHAIIEPTQRTVPRIWTGLRISTISIALIALAGIEEGGLGILVVGVFISGASLLAVLARRHGIPSHVVGFASIVGLVSHPFGDIFVGQPPKFLYPFIQTTFDPIVFSGTDPTLNFLVILLIELLCVWGGLHAIETFSEHSTIPDSRPFRILILAFGGFVWFFPPPTVNAPYQFVYGLLGLALLTSLPSLIRRVPLRIIRTGAVTFSDGVVVYGIMYILTHAY